MSLEIEYEEKRHTLRWVVLILIFGILGYLGWAGYTWYTSGNLLLPFSINIADTSIDESNVTKDQVATYTVPALRPRFISIPGIQLSETRVYPTGLNAAGLLVPSHNINDVAWYNKSDLPGNEGVIIIEGHNKGLTNNGAFADIGELKKGDKVILERGDSHKYTYKVVDSHTMSVSDITNKSKTLIGSSAVSDEQGLNLITFDGKWVPKLGTFDQRLLVRSVIDSKA